MPELKSIGGLHVMDAPPIDEVIRDSRRIKAGCIKYLSNPDQIRLVYEAIPDMRCYVQRYWWEGHLGNPDRFRMLRDYMAGRSGKPFDPEADSVGDAFDPYAAAEEWLAKADNQNPINIQPLIGMNNVYMESANESFSGLDYYRFESARTILLWERHRIRSSVLNFGVGNNIDSWKLKHPGFFAREIPLYEALRRTGSMLGVHAYFGMIWNMWHADLQKAYADGRPPLHLSDHRRERQIHPLSMINAWLATRTANYHDQMKNDGYGDLRIFVSEGGLDRAGAETYQHFVDYNGEVGLMRTVFPYYTKLGWTRPDYPPEYVYADELNGKISIEAQNRVYHPILQGYVIFTYGSHGKWIDADIRNTRVIERMEQNANAYPFVVETGTGDVDLACEVSLVEGVSAVNIRSTPIFPPNNTANRTRQLLPGASEPVDYIYINKVEGVDYRWYRLKSGEYITARPDFVKLDEDCANLRIVTEAEPEPEPEPEESCEDKVILLQWELENSEDEIESLAQQIEIMGSKLNKYEQGILAIDEIVGELKNE